ncbi:MAG: hypothetical protein RL233_1677 [Bacteroidota bacterium]
MARGLRRFCREYKGVPNKQAQTFGQNRLAEAFCFGGNKWERGRMALKARVFLVDFELMVDVDWMEIVAWVATVD